MIMEIFVMRLEVKFSRGSSNGQFNERIFTIHDQSGNFTYFFISQPIVILITLS